MINDFYITAKDIIDPKTKDLSLYSCKLTSQMLNGTKTAMELINKIETFNDKKPRAKRMAYTITLNGSSAPLFVAKTKVIDTNWIIVYAYSRNGSSSFTTAKDGSIKLVDGVSTHMVNAANIIDVSFGSFDADDCDFLIETLSDAPITEDKMVNILSEEITLLNSNISAGEYRNAINQFCIFMKNNKINDYEFDYNRIAYTNYVTLCTTYMNLIKNIMGHYNDPTLNKTDLSVPSTMYFFKDKPEMLETCEKAEHTRMNITINNSFFEEDIKIFKKILEED